MLGSAQIFRRRLLVWFARHGRVLPWRPEHTCGAADAYRVLVSEIMLQQTQVTTVIDYFHRFIREYPTLVDLAGAPEQRVLKLWQGLGYYRRARQLRAAARMAIEDYGGQIPRRVEQLLTLPGVGPYTAGAIASIAFGQRAPILDGNVARVLSRLDGQRGDAARPGAVARLWRRAREILPADAARAGAFNSALMDLGATICVPRSPRCDVCPVRAHCRARALGIEQTIPPPRRRPPVPLLTRWTLCIGRGRRWLLEQRPTTGRWPGMWQFPTVANPPPRSIGPTTRLAELTHLLTHRRYCFRVLLAPAAVAVHLPPGARRRWLTLRQIDAYPLPRPHQKVTQLLAAGSLTRPDKGPVPIAEERRPH